MAAVRKTRTGRFELTITNKLLPKGRAWFTFDTQAEAEAYGAQAEKWLAAGLVPPDLAADTKQDRAALLGPLIRARASSGNAAASEQPELDRLYAELGAVPLRDVTYTWAEGWVRQMKLQHNLAPSTIRRRVQALARAIDDQLRRTPDAMAGNPLRLLPKGYSTYGPGDRAAVAKLAAAGQDVAVRVDQVRDRRLRPGEEAAIRAALAGEKRADRERPLAVDAEFTLLFEVLLLGGLRLREAYRLRVDQVDLQARVMRPQQSKLWHGKVVHRTVPLVPALLDALQHHLAAREPQDRPALLFPGLWDGGDVSDAGLKRTTGRLSSRFSTLFAYAGAPDLTEHDLRHEATCRWLELRDARGGWMFRPEEVMRIMGWAPGSRMIERYASFRPEDLAGRLYLVSDQSRVA